MKVIKARELGILPRARWEVPMFFHVLKNGCQVEALQLTSMARLERALQRGMLSPLV
jgi:hypothetical protein